MSVTAICVDVGKVGIITNLLLGVGDTCSTCHRTNHTEKEMFPWE